MAEPYVVARDLGKAFDGRPVLAHLDFVVAPGDIVGVLGENGAGKTTLLELILGYTPPSAGSVTVFGHESRRLPGADKRRIGFVPQTDELVSHLTVAAHIALISSFYAAWDAALVARLVQKWGIDTRVRVGTMSVGQRQKLAIVLALGHRPDLLLLDEPVASLDPIARRHFLEEIVEIATDERRAVIFSSHIVADIERLANRIWIVRGGALLWAGDADTLRSSVVRLHLRACATPLEHLSLPNAIRIEPFANGGIAVMRDWRDELTADIAARAGGSLELERLTLEEIFLELHR